MPYALQVNTANNNIESSRLLNLHQYMAMRKEILFQMEAFASPNLNTRTADEVGSETEMPGTSNSEEFMASAYFTP